MRPVESEEAVSSDVVSALNALWTAERALIDQYVARSKHAAHTGEAELAKRFHDFAFTEMREVSAILDRIIALGGIPQLEQVPPVPVGATREDKIALSIAAEEGIIARLEQTIDTCRAGGDAETSALLAEDLERERDHLDWLRKLEP